MMIKCVLIYVLRLTSCAIYCWGLNPLYLFLYGWMETCVNIQEIKGTNLNQPSQLEFFHAQY